MATAEDAVAAAVAAPARVWTCKEILFAEENKPTTLKLLKYMTLMVLAPLSTFFIARDWAFAGLQDSARNTCSSLCAVFMVNLVISAYVYEAFVSEKATGEEQGAPRPAAAANANVGKTD
ncbi:hypothetical protein JKP88DRAFT_323002 [Tribonema minus]|uniref:Vacuolar ATPase assembly integral membrane protein VMA21 homolog n=1 Tax=Tribonema minus TaxID=303371 RepID=A0A836CD65_9STRA|nr:hypothetical protein JKP88DRAFT_323002 [Tribonema minus]